jgi:hypothetical protein
LTVGGVHGCTATTSYSHSQRWASFAAISTMPWKPWPENCQGQKSDYSMLRHIIRTVSGLISYDIPWNTECGIRNWESTILPSWFEHFPPFIDTLSLWKLHAALHLSFHESQETLFLYHALIWHYCKASKR